MTEAERVSGGLNPDLALRVFEFGASRPGQVEIVNDEARGWLALEEPQSTFAFAEVEGDELRILPFLVPRDRLKKSRLGAFAWPEVLEPQTWEGYRSADKDGSRSLDVAPKRSGTR